MKRVNYSRVVYCDCCRRLFRAARKDAKYCSAACRKRASRAGQVKHKKPVTQVTIHQLELLLVQHGGQ